MTDEDDKELMLVARAIHRSWYESGRQIPPPFPTDLFELLRWMLIARAALDAVDDAEKMGLR